ncbi:hypothetical protein FKM82_015819 [Ascaphus truei]
MHSLVYAVIVYTHGCTHWYMQSLCIHMDALTGICSHYVYTWMHSLIYAVIMYSIHMDALTSLCSNYVYTCIISSVRRP